MVTDGSTFAHRVEASRVCAGGWASPRDRWMGCLNLYCMRHSTGSSRDTAGRLIVKARESLRFVPTEDETVPKAVAQAFHG